MFNLFKKTWDPEKLGAALSRVLNKCYYVMIGDDSVGIKMDDVVVAYITLSKDKTGARVSYSVQCPPHFAAEIALQLEIIVSTDVNIDALFTAKRADEGATNDVH